MKKAERNTRKRILESIYRDIKLNGFRACRPDKVIAELNITKGALYYYFPNKLVLGYAVVDEILKPGYLEYWQPLKEFEGNAIDFLIQRLRNIQKFFNQSNEAMVGSPLSNLIQEMAPQDEGFRERLESVVKKIQEIVTDALRRSQEKGFINNEINPQRLAWFYISSIEGSYNLAKVSNDKTIFVESLNCLAEQLEEMKNK
ncbi:MAG: TetR/AcrR family transcriptional regulator [Prolixibacteraceae bacterium]